MLTTPFRTAKLCLVLDSPFVMESLERWIVKALHLAEIDIRFHPRMADDSFVSPLICGLVKTTAHILKLIRCPHSLAATLAALPSMSLNPSAPFACRLC
jgi:hypothetical protein